MILQKLHNWFLRAINFKETTNTTIDRSSTPLLNAGKGFTWLNNGFCKKKYCTRAVINRAQWLEPSSKISKKNWLTRLPASALAEGPLWHDLKVAGTTQSIFIGKNVRLYGPNLLHKLGKCARVCTPYSLMSQVSLDIYGVFYEEF